MGSARTFPGFFEIRCLISIVVVIVALSSLNASLAQWLIGSGRAPASYTAAQGTVLGRSGRIHITSDETDVWVAGSTTTLLTGHLV